MKLSKIKPATPPRATRTDWKAVADMLRAAPGIWHELPDAPKTSTTDFRRGALAFSPSGAFDAVRRGGVLFMRYVGEPVKPWRDPVTFAPAVDEHGEPYAFDALPRDPDYSDAPQP